MRYTNSDDFGDFLMVEDIDEYLIKQEKRLVKLGCSEQYIETYKYMARLSHMNWIHAGKPEPRWEGLTL